MTHPFPLPILAKPQVGWSHIFLPNFDSRLSYLDDVAVLLLQDLILGYLDKHTSAVTFDCEGWDTTIVLTDFSIYGIKTDTEPSCFTEVSGYVYVFIHEIITEIEQNLDLWASFTVMESDEQAYQKETEKNKATIKHLIQTIKEHKNYA